MMYSLPAIGKPAIALSHFPTRHQAFIFRACEYVPMERIARVLGTDVGKVRQAAEDMGLPDYAPGELWLSRGYITIIRRMWHILPYEQLLELLDTDEQALARLMREDDFLDIKLSDKPYCERVTWRELTAEEAEKTRRIKEIMSGLDMAGKAPFSFEYDVPRLTFSGEERFATRMIYAFSGLYQHAFDVDSEEFLPDEQLEAYQALGINGIWTQGVLSQLTPFPFDPSVSAGYEERLARMRHLTKRLARFGIKLYLYLNEPRSMPLAFFDAYPELRGHTWGGDACLCISTPQVKAYLADAVASLCRAVPLIGGFFTITRSENLTNCYSHADHADYPCLCPRCKDRSVGEVVSDTVGCILEGARRVSRDVQVFAWSWGWGEYSEQIIRRLPKEVILLSQSELDVPFERGGVTGRVIDYSMSVMGPGERARREWALAKECGLDIGAKVQVNTTWEASTVPAIPVTPSVEEHVKNLRDEGVRHLLLSWTLGGYPCRNLAAAAEYFYEGCSGAGQSPALTEAEAQFTKAFREFPFHLTVLYFGPQNAGPSNLLFETPTGYRSGMTCLAYDDLETWRGIYPVEVFESQLEKLCEGWARGLALLPAEGGESTVMAKAAYCLFYSSLCQVRFIRARDEGRYADAIAEAERELETAKLMLSLMNQNAAIGYEAANHYYFSKGQLAEKIVCCHHIVEAFSKKKSERRGIAIAGNVLTDSVKLIDIYPEKGMLTNISSISKAVGGCVPNTIINLAKIDRSIPLYAYGMVGDDDGGKYVTLEMQKNGVDVSGVVISDSKATSFSDVMSVAATGERTFFHHKGANSEFSPSHVSLDSITCRMLHIGYILLLDEFDREDPEYGTVMARFLKSVQEAGIRTSIDVVSDSGKRFAEKVIPALRYTDNAIMNEIEGCGVSGLEPRGEDGRINVDNIRLTLQKILDCGVSERAIIHAPEAGFCLNTRGEFSVVPSLKLPAGYVKGSVGAGDAFCAGCLYGIYNGLSDRDILEFASGAAACSLAEADSISGMQSKEYIVDLIGRTEKGTV